MRIPRPPHGWRVSPREAVAIQRKLAGRVRTSGSLREARLVAGVDAAFSRDGRRCIGAAVLWDLEAGAVLEQHVAIRPLRFPYVPGLLSFREAPAELAALAKLRRRPDVILCDGHGVAHPRRFGIACHVGVLTRVPTIGCAKSRLVGTHGAPGPGRGARAALRDAGERIGTVLRTRDGRKPIFVSVGHLIDLGAAARIALACATRYRLPEPVRLADRLVAAVKRGEGGG